MINRTDSTEENQMSNKIMKRCSISLVIKAMTFYIELTKFWNFADERTRKVNIPILLVECRLFKKNGRKL